MLTSMLLLTGCKPEAEIAVRCPGLANPPPAVVTALKKAGQGDEKARAWVIKLHKHYQKLGVCKQI